MGLWDWLFGVAPSQSEAWKPYLSRKEKFSAMFPGEVARQFLGFFKDDGESPGTVVYASKSRDGVMYKVNVTRVMEYYGAPEDFLATAAAEMAKSIRECVISAQNYENFRECPALSFEATIRGIFPYSGIIVLRERTLYVLTATVLSGGAHEFSRFVSEFRFIRVSSG